MDQQALAAKLKHPLLELYKDIAPHGRFTGIDDGEHYQVSIWCHPEMENIFYYTSTGFDSSLDFLSIFIIIDDIVKFRHARADGSSDGDFMKDSDVDELDIPLLEALHKARFTYLLEQKLRE